MQVILEKYPALIKSKVIEKDEICDDAMEEGGD